MDDTRRCTATSKRTRVRCKKAPLLGAMVCRTHGGGAPQVRRKAAERLADLIDPNRALREAARLAYSDVGALFDEDGHLRPVHTLPPEVRAAIASIEIVRKNLASGNRTQEYVHKVKLWDKPTSLALLFKHLGLLVERLEHLGTLNIRWAWPTAEELDTMERQALPKALPAPVTRGDADL